MTRPARQSLLPISFALLLSACGGGSDGSPATSIAPKPNPTPTPSVVPPVSTSPPNRIPDAPTDQLDNNDALEALTGSNAISIARQSCGLGGALEDTALSNVAIKHANYIRHVFTNSNISAFNPHEEAELIDAKHLSSKNNPFFSGLTFSDRLIVANYPRHFSAFENISTLTQYHSEGQLATPEAAAQTMVNSLLAAPYHLKSLMSPNIAVTATSLMTYTPFGTDSNTNRGYILVNHSAANQASQNKTVSGIFTYPCDKVVGTATALYHEAPDPFKGSRDLRNNPIGQPIYINMPTAKTIKVSNVRFIDVKRGESIPVQLLDSSSDPYKGSNYAVAANEVFILPLTDDLKSCESGKHRNCGLYGNSDYNVSFDVLVDNKVLQNKRFTFRTGAVNY